MQTKEHNKLLSHSQREVPLQTSIFQSGRVCTAEIACHLISIWMWKKIFHNAEEFENVFNCGCNDARIVQVCMMLARVRYTDYFQADMLGVWYKSVSVGAAQSPGSRGLLPLRSTN